MSPREYVPSENSLEIILTQRLVAAVAVQTPNAPRRGLLARVQVLALVFSERLAELHSSSYDKTTYGHHVRLKLPPDLRRPDGVLVGIGFGCARRRGLAGVFARHGCRC